MRARACRAQHCALDQRTGLVLGQSQQDADTGCEVLNNTKSQLVSLTGQHCSLSTHLGAAKAAQSKSVSSPAGHVTGSLEEIKVSSQL